VQLGKRGTEPRRPNARPVVRGFVVSSEREREVSGAAVHFVVFRRRVTPRAPPTLRLRTRLRTYTFPLSHSHSPLAKRTDRYYALTHMLLLAYTFLVISGGFSMSY